MGECLKTDAVLRGRDTGCQQCRWAWKKDEESADDECNGTSAPVPVQTKNHEALELPPVGFCTDQPSAAEVILWLECRNRRGRLNAAIAGVLAVISFFVPVLGFLIAIAALHYAAIAETFFVAVKWQKTVAWISVIMDIIIIVVHIFIIMFGMM